jgi:uncharacterized protein (TIGR03435 family)
MRFVVLLALGACGVFSQTFEVASIRPADPRQGWIDFVISPGGHLRITNVPLGQIIREAYELKFFQMSGGPPWLNTDGYNIEAKAAGEPSRREMMAMLRSLLEERFRLKVRRETREGSVYELVVAKGGPKLKASTAETSYLRLYRHTPPELPGVSYTIAGQKVAIAKLADDLMGTVQRRVFDRTGITGEFDFKIDYAVEGHSEDGPSIFTALQEQLGLKLQAAKGPVEHLIVESAERPSAN